MFQDFKENVAAWQNTLQIAGHIGIDISSGDGDPVFAYLDGTVVYVQPDTVVYLTEPDSDGTCLEITIGHMKNQAVTVGQKVKKGDKLGEQDSVGNTILPLGWSHQHIGIRIAQLGGEQNKGYRWNFQLNSPVPYHIVEYDASVEHFREPRLFSSPVLELVARLGITRQEGARADRNNPGDLRVTPYTMTLGATGNIGSIASFLNYETGLKALYQLLTDACNGELRAYKKNMSVLDFFRVYAPSSDNNTPDIYAKNVVMWCGLNSVNDPISDWLLSEVDYIRKYHFIPGIGPTGSSIYPQTFWLVEWFKEIWNSVSKLGK